MASCTVKILGHSLHVFFLIQGPLHHMYKAFDAYTQPTKGTTQALVDSVVGTPPLSALLSCVVKEQARITIMMPQGTISHTNVPL